MTALPFDTHRFIEICRQHDVAKIGVFGSMATGRSQRAKRPRSVDRILETTKPPGADGIALATVEDETTANEQPTRPNVENEIGMLQTASDIGARIIYLKEAGVTFASNYEEKVWILLEKERVQDAFIAMAKELRAFGFLD